MHPDELLIENVRADIDTYVIEQSGTSSTERGEAFLRWVCEHLLPQTTEDNFLELDGTGDQGIDAVAFAFERLWIVQSKFGTAHNSDAAKAFAVVAQTVRHFLEGGNCDLPLGLVRFLEQIKLGDGGNELDLSEVPLQALYVTNARFSDQERRQYKVICENNPHLKIEDLLGITSTIQISQQLKPSVVGDLCFAEPPIAVSSNSAYLGVANLDELARFSMRAGDQLFDANVRSWLKRTTVNKGIAATLASEPEKFFYYNNGVTIVCDSITPNGSTLHLVGAQVVNGCQTVNEIVEASVKYAKSNTMLQGSILVKVISVESDSLRQRISQSTNSQNTIRIRDFLSMAKEQKSLQRAFEKIGYYYEISRGQSALLKTAKKRKLEGLLQYSYLGKPGRFRKIVAFDSQQCFLAAYVDKPGVAKNTLGQHDPLDHAYEEVFEGCQSLDPLHHLMPVLVYEAASRFDYGLGRREWKSHARLFYVCVVFRVIAELLRMKGVAGLGADNLIRDPNLFGSFAAKVFAIQEMGEALLELADYATYDFNTAIMYKDDGRDYNERNSYRRDAQRKDPEIDKLLTGKIKRWIGDRKYRELVRFVDETAI